MAKKSLDRVLQHVRMMAAVHAYRDIADAELLRRFVELSDEAAFTVLVERYGPMLLGVCRRALGNVHDAEDGCQAAFLALARKAASIRQGTSLASWLHGVGCRVAASLKRERARRQRRERAAETPLPKDFGGEVSWREVQTVLDEELAQLPERYRTPLILCYLDGKTRDEAAGQLGLSSGSLHGRLERGRELLRQRLTRRGLTLSAALFATALGEGAAHAALPATFVISTSKAALALVGAQSITDGVIPVGVLTLTREVLRNMFVAKLKLGSAVMLGACLLAAITGGAVTSIGAAQDVNSEAAKHLRLEAVKSLVGAAPKAENDEAFIRRVSLDLRGTEPTPTEIHFFVASKDAGRRQKLIDLMIQERQAKQKADRQEAQLAAFKASMEMRHEQVAVNVNGDIDKALIEAQDKLKRQKEKLRVLAGLLGTGDKDVLTLKQKTLIEEYSLLRRELLRLDSDIRRGEILLSGQRDDLKKLASPALIEGTLAKDPHVEAARKIIAHLEARIKNYRAQVNPDNPRLAEMTKELAEARDNLKARLEPEIAKVNKEMEATEKRLQLLREQHKEATRKVEDVQASAEKIGKGSFELEIRRAEIDEAEMELKNLRASKELLEIKKWQNYDRDVPAKNGGNEPKLVGLAAIHQEYLRDFLAAKGQPDAVALTRSYLNRLLQYVKGTPQNIDCADAMLQIVTIYTAQGKTVEAGAWREKLLREHPNSAAAKSVK